VSFAEADLERLVPHLDPDSTLYVADEDLRVIYSNEAWNRFAAANAGAGLVGPARNTRLLANMSGTAKDRWKSIYDLLRAQRLPHYEEDFICSSPQERRIYRLRVTPVQRPDGAGTWLVHHAVRIDDSAEEREDLRRRLRELESDPGLLESEYRTRVMEREVDVPGYGIAVHFEPLEDIGGDVLWQRGYGGDEHDLVVADAMGHGFEAGVHAAKLVMMLDALSSGFRDPQDLLATLNRGLIQNRPEHESAFASGIHFRFQRGSRRLRCANFGHMGPIFSRSGQVHLKLGLALGMVDTIPIWPTTELDLDEHGTRFLVFSDGIIEQFNSDGEMYGTERLLGAFRASLDVDVDAMLRNIIGDLNAFRGDALVKDDLTVIALELIE
jgi:serine phosphatase RsbU (regulator of sigma subunit)